MPSARYNGASYHFSHFQPLHPAMRCDPTRPGETAPAASQSPTLNGGAPGRLAKQLGLWDVYTISTGAMFSSGFFLLPGLATGHAGPSTALAYLVAGLMMVPALFCMGELATALPRAGGAYYFLDRSMGPGMGTVGGLGVWLALVLKSSFALLGMGAYLAIAPGIADRFPQDPDHRLWIIKGLAVALTLLFAGINIFGAKQSSRLQATLVVIILAVLGFFVVQGLWYVWFHIPHEELGARYTPFFHEQHGLHGFLATIGLVFVSYAGLTKVASVSEEVKRPERDLPLGMILSLITTTVIYVLGVSIMIATVDREQLRHDYTPVATAAEAFFDWLPSPVGLILVIAAAMAAFASTANAGILSASRYPLAMSRDRLVGETLGRIGRFGTPTPSILITAGFMMVSILLLSAEGVAKLASSFNLVIFGLTGLAVLVMRESRIESYDPGFRCPFYPWTPLVSIGISIVLIWQMGIFAALLALGVIALGVTWYVVYARHRVVRTGAVYHVFARLGHHRYEPLDQEFRQIIKEKGLRKEDPFDEVVARAGVIDAETDTTFEALVERAAEILDRRLPLPKSEIHRQILEAGRQGRAPVSSGVALPHFRVPGIEQPELVLVRARTGIALHFFQPDSMPPDPSLAGKEPPRPEEHSPRHIAEPNVVAIFLLVSPEDNAGAHLRMLAQIAGRVEQEDFLDTWLRAEHEADLKETLLRDERFIALTLDPKTSTGPLIGRRVAQGSFPKGTLVALILREDQFIVPRGRTVLQAGDRLTIIGQTAGIAELYQRYKPHETPPATGK